MPLHQSQWLSPFHTKRPFRVLYNVKRHGVRASQSLKKIVKKGLSTLAHAFASEARHLPLDHWGLTRDADERLHLDGIDLLQITEANGSPVHLVNGPRLDKNLRDILGARGPGGHRLEVYYSYKTNPLPHVLQRLHAGGAGAEVISEYELELALHLGVAPQRIVYNGPAKADRAIRLAIEKDILLLNINHHEEIERVARLAGELGKRPSIGIRVNTMEGWSEQFGFSTANGEALAAYKLALSLPQLNVIGLHSHRGRTFYDLMSLQGYLHDLLLFVQQLEDQLGFRPALLDLGGSLGVPSVSLFSKRELRMAQTLGLEIDAPDPSQRLTPTMYAETILHMLSEHYAARGAAIPRILVEVGRGITGNAQMLVSRVISTKTPHSGPTYAILDTGINIAHAMRAERHQIFKLTPGCATRHLYRLAGPLCHPGDIICHAVRLPELMPGDALLIMDTGAYFESGSTAFAVERPATVMLDGDRASVIRRRETLGDMVQRDRYQ